MSRFALIFAFACAAVLCGPLPVRAQSADSIDLNGMLARMKTARQANGKLAEQYTSDEFWHNVNYDKKGKRTLEHSARFENIFLEGLPYRRKLEADGKPLSGKEAAAEQARYDKAVRERRSMSIQQKRGLLHWSFSSSFPDCCLLTAFDNRIVRREVLNGHETVVVESVPKPNYTPRDDQEKSARHWKETAWIDVQDTMPVRFQWELLTSFGRFQKGSTGQFDFERIPLQPSSPAEPGQSVWLQQNAKFNFRFKLLWIEVTGATEQTWSNYKRFHVDMRLLDDTVQEVPSPVIQ